MAIATPIAPSTIATRQIKLSRPVARSTPCVSAGLVISIPAITWINLSFGWRSAFVLTGAAGFSWLVLWLWLFRLPREQKTITPAELRHISGDAARGEGSAKTPYLTLLGSRTVWAASS